MNWSVFWLIAAGVLVVGEALTVGLTFIWFALGAVAGLVAATLGWSIWTQMAVFLVVSGLALALVRPTAAKLLGTKRVATNADRVIGMIARVTEPIDNVQGTGRVNVGGQIWTARNEESGVIPEGAEVKISRIEGVKVFVEAN